MLDRPPRAAGPPAAGRSSSAPSRSGARSPASTIIGGIANTRDLGPALGGLLGGPVVGIGAGLIGGVQRLAMGGFDGRAVGARAPWPPASPAASSSCSTSGASPRSGRPCCWRSSPSRCSWGSTCSWPAVRPGAAAGPGRHPADDPRQRRRHGPVRVHRAATRQRERATTAQKERMEGELTVARDIQRGIVPTIFPPFPEREEFDLHAVAGVGARGGRRPLRLLPARRRPPVPGHRRRLGQGRAGLAVHGRHDHAAARRGAPRRRPARCWRRSTRRCAAATTRPCS